MKRYYKVYANCCRVSNPIKEVQKSELTEVIAPLINAAIDSKEFDTMVADWDNQVMVNQAIQNIYEKAIDILEEHEQLNCGDFCVIATTGIPKSRPNMCGFDTYLLFD